MLLILYSTKSGSNVINKTLENPINVDIIARSDFDIITPQLKLSEISGVDFKDYNYCHIPDLNRYYFINSVSAMNADIFSFECECDVLESYKDEILSGQYRFKRNIKTGDYLNFDIDSNVKRNVKLFESNKELEQVKTLIISTLGA